VTTNLSKETIAEIRSLVKTLVALNLKGKRMKPRPNALMLTVGEAARELGVHVNTVRRWADEGKLESFKLNPRGDRRFKRSYIQTFLSDGQHKGPDIPL